MSQKFIPPEKPCPKCAAEKAVGNSYCNNCGRMFKK